MGLQKENGISWTATVNEQGQTVHPGYTANFWSGCVKVSAMCDNCYAETLTKRFGLEVWGADARRSFGKGVWNDLDKWEKDATKTGVRPRVFVMSLGDFFEQLPDGHPDREIMDAKRQFAMERMERDWTHLDFLVLTKRISNVAKMVPADWLTGKWPANVRLGISVGTQADADRDIPRLLALPCPNFLSMEPLLELVTLRPEWLQAISWLICGGESGPHARPSHPDWFRKLRDDCKAAGVPFHFKQPGVVLAKEWGCKHHKGAIPAEWPSEFNIQEFPRTEEARG